MGKYLARSDDGHLVSASFVKAAMGSPNDLQPARKAPDLEVRKETLGG